MASLVCHGDRVPLLALNAATTVDVTVTLYTLLIDYSKFMSRTELLSMPSPLLDLCRNAFCQSKGSGSSSRAMEERTFAPKDEEARTH